MRGTVALALSAALVLAGCQGGGRTDGSPSATRGPGAAGPLVAEDVVRLDLREAPTREEAGLRDGERDLVLTRVGETLDVELQLPGGTLAVDAFRVNLGGPLGEPDPSYAQTVLVNVRAGDTAAVRDLLSGQASLLGLDPGQVQDWAAGAATPDRRGNRFFRSATTEPAIEVEVRAEGAASWTLNYSFVFAQPPGAAGRRS